MTIAGIYFTAFVQSGLLRTLSILSAEWTSGIRLIAVGILVWFYHQLNSHRHYNNYICILIHKKISDTFIGPIHPDVQLINFILKLPKIEHVIHTIKPLDYSYNELARSLAARLMWQVSSHWRREFKLADQSWCNTISQDDVVDPEISISTSEFTDLTKAKKCKISNEVDRLVFQKGCLEKILCQTIGTPSVSMIESQLGRIANDAIVVVCIMNAVITYYYNNYFTTIINYSPTGL